MKLRLDEPAVCVADAAEVVLFLPAGGQTLILDATAPLRTPEGAQISLRTEIRIRDAVYRITCEPGTRLAALARRRGAQMSSADLAVLTELLAPPPPAEFPPPAPSAPQAETPAIPEPPPGMAWQAESARIDGDFINVDFVAVPDPSTELSMSKLAPDDIRNLAERGIDEIFRSPLDEAQKRAAIEDLIDALIEAALTLAPDVLDAIYKLIVDLGERDPKNLRARAARARAKGKTEKAERLEAKATEIESRR